MRGMMADSVEERFAHVEGGTVEHQRISAMLVNQFIHRDGISRRENFVAKVAQRESQ